MHVSNQRYSFPMVPESRLHVSEVHQRACQSDGGLARYAVYRNTEKAKAYY